VVVLQKLLMVFVELLLLDLPPLIRRR